MAGAERDEYCCFRFACCERWACGCCKRSPQKASENVSKLMALARSHIFQLAVAVTIAVLATFYLNPTLRSITSDVNNLKTDTSNLQVLTNDMYAVITSLNVSDVTNTVKRERTEMALISKLIANLTANVNQLQNIAASSEQSIKQLNATVWTDLTDWARQFTTNINTTVDQMLAPQFQALNDRIASKTLVVNQKFMKWSAYPAAGPWPVQNPCPEGTQVTGCTMDCGGRAGSAQFYSSGCNVWCQGSGDIIVYSSCSSMT